MPPTPAFRLTAATVLLASCAHAPDPPQALSSALPGYATVHEHAHAAHTTRLEVDAARREIVITAGPFQVPVAGEHAHEHPDRTPLIEFDWPVDGWLRGFRVTAFDASGRELPRDIMHHLIAYNFSRRQLIHPGVERLFGMGSETGDIVVSKRVGIPLQAGSRIGFDAVWHNELGEALDEVHVRVAMVYTPERAKPIRYEGMPFHVDVNYSVAGSNEFDIPRGRSEHSVEFVMPVSGRLIGVGGHLHAFGTALRLEDAETDRTLFTLRTRTDSASRVVVRPRVFPKLLGLRDSRMRLEAGRRYRLVGEYVNDSGEPIPMGAMAHIAGLFKPDDFAEWPALDLSDPDIAEDIAVLRGEKPRDSGGHGHQHGGSNQ